MKNLIGCLVAVAIGIFPLGLAADQFSRPVVLPVPDSAEYQVKRDVAYTRSGNTSQLADIYVPDTDTSANPAIIFVHGGPVPQGLDKGMKDAGQYKSYGALAASNGLVGVTFNYPFPSLDKSQNASRSIDTLISFVRDRAEEFSLDRDNICLWFFSGGGNFVAPAITGAPEWLQCVAIYYGVMGPGTWKAWDMTLPSDQRQGLDPFTVLESGYSRHIPMFIAEAGEDNRTLNAQLRRFMTEALEQEWPVEYWNHPTAPHAFDVVQDDKRSRDIIQGTFEFIRQEVQ